MLVVCNRCLDLTDAYIQGEVKGTKEKLENGKEMKAHF